MITGQSIIAIKKHSATKAFQSEVIESAKSIVGREHKYEWDKDDITLIKEKANDIIKLLNEIARL